MIDYEIIARQVEAFCDGEINRMGLLANIAALLKEHGKWHWVGFYIVDRDDTDPMLILGPFQGPSACMVIGYGKGVCGTSWKDRRTHIVGDVEEFPGHIACSSLSRSEIVVPIIVMREVVGVLDIDSVELNAFGPSDSKGLEKVCAILSERWAETRWPK